MSTQDRSTSGQDYFLAMSTTSSLFKSEWEMNMEKLAYIYKGFRLCNFYVNSEEDMQSIYNLPIRENDIVVATYPKAGTHLMLAIVRHILFGPNTKISNTSLASSSQGHIKNNPLYLPSGSSDQLQSAWFDGGHQRAQEMLLLPERGIFTTHLHYDLLPKSIQMGKGKVIYVVRNPKDVSVSLYHYGKIYKPFQHAFTGELDLDYIKEFANNGYYGPWWKQVLGYWEHKNDDNIFFIKYEEIIEMKTRIIEKVADFIGKKLEAEEIQSIAEQTNFTRMKKNPNIYCEDFTEDHFSSKNQSDFFRKGLVGDWKKYFTPEMNEVIDNMVQSKLGHTGMSFKYE